ncbi:MAG TPA: ABC transporter substrate-binding protein [Pseudolabrys sp.]|nr:ABC transporter substrate-binding protein [Pseudolabrys sp.]
MRRRQFIILLGGAAVWPALGQAQQPTVTTIGFMSGRALEDSKHLLAAFHQGLGEAGFVEGKNVAVEYRWALGQYDRLPALATDLVNRRVAVLAAVGGDPSPLAAKQATSTIPVVFGMGGDPIKAGLVESISRPNSNMTGFTLLTNELEPKRLGILRDLLPGLSVVGVLLNPNFPPAVGQVLALENAAQTTGQQLIVLRASNDTELEPRLASLLQQGAGALLVAADPYFDTKRDRLVAFAAQNKLPAIYQFREFAVAGGLISYGPSITDSYRHAGAYVGQILKGAKPADLPVLQPTKFEFVINLKTARTLGLAIPPGLISFADEVIE